MTDAPISFAELLDAFFPQQQHDAGQPHIKDGRIIAPYVDEVGLRRNVAVVARAYGWNVQEEVVVPGWGRIDLVLTEPAPSPAFLVELKLDLTKPAKVRKAFQQADGYGRWWAAHRSQPSYTYLVSVDCDPVHVSVAQQVYPHVHHVPGAEFLTRLATLGDPKRRIPTARQHLGALRSRVSVHEHAVEVLGQLVGT